MKKLGTFVAGGLLISGLSLPQAAFAISGCSNASLRGTFDVQITNLGLQNFVQSLDQSTATAPSGLTANDNSLIGNQAASGRFLFNGNGSIVGAATVPKGAHSFNTPIGSYKINTDCSGMVTIGSAKYDIVVTKPGKSALFLETDSAGAGTLGTLMRSGACTKVVPGSSYVVSFSSVTTSGTIYTPYSELDTVTLLGNNVANIASTVYENGKVTQSANTASYSIGADCTLSVKVNGGGTYSGVISNNGAGSLTYTPDQKTSAASGTLEAQ